jgi:hypothetical protein
MFFSHTPSPLTVTIPDLLIDHKQLNTRAFPDHMVYTEIHRLALEPVHVPHQIGGRLASFHRNWGKITNDPWVLSVVSGYQIDWSNKKTSEVPHAHSKISVSENEILINASGRDDSKASHTGNCPCKGAVHRTHFSSEVKVRQISADIQPRTTEPRIQL